MLKRYLKLNWVLVIRDSCFSSSLLSLSRADVLFLDVFVILNALNANVEIAFLEGATPPHYTLSLIKCCNSRITAIWVDINAITHPITRISICKLLQLVLMTIHFNPVWDLYLLPRLRRSIRTLRFMISILMVFFFNYLCIDFGSNVILPSCL